MEFFEAPAFTRCVSGYLADDEYRELQSRLACTGGGRYDPGNRRIPEAPLGGPKARKGTKRGPASDLLLLPRQATDLAHDPLRQERSIGPNAQRKASSEKCN
jgi:hypothetical protein